MFFDTFYEGRKPRPLFLLRQERLAPYRELDVKLHCKTHMTCVVSQKGCQETLLEGKHPVGKHMCTRVGTRAMGGARASDLERRFPKAESSLSSIISSSTPHRSLCLIGLRPLPRRLPVIWCCTFVVLSAIRSLPSCS